LRRLLQLLIIVAFVARGLVPAGYMLAEAERDGTWQVVVCTGQGPLAIDLDSDGAPHEPGGGKSAPETCAFAISLPFELPKHSLPAGPSLSLEITRSPAPQYARVNARTTTPLPARGPPLLS
jgi:hypothetical protein